MRPISRWAHMMSTSASIAPQTGVDDYGKPTYGAAKSYRAHIGRKTTFVRTMGGQQLEAGQTVWLDTSDAILATAQLTLSTGDVGSTEPSLTQPTIISVERLSDENGPHHTVLYLQ